MIRLNPVPVVSPRKIFIMAGQSNMVGHGVLAQLPAFPRANRVFIYRYNEAWDVGAEPMSNHAGIVYSVFLDDENLASCGMAFADHLASLQLGYEIGLVPCAKGGSGMDDWERNLSTSTMYGAMIARAQAAAVAGDIAGLIWYQGEEDSKNSTDANAWAANFEQFVEDVRDDLDLPNLPIVHTQLGPDNELSGREYWSVVQAQQAAVDLDFNAMVTASDLTTLGDDLHLNTASLVTLGQRYAVAMAALL